MAVNCGIVGLPNVGKSTIFSALTSAPAEAANYPFCTIDPNVGIVDVPDERLRRIDSMIPADKQVAATVEFVDIAGLVRGASRGEGLGNQFLAHIRETGIICHVVRCFSDEDITHVDGTIDPARDIETLNIELALADLASVQKRLEKTERQTRANDAELRKKAETEMGLLDRIAKALDGGKPASSLTMNDDERQLLSGYQLITGKPMLYICNVAEDSISGSDERTTAYIDCVRETAAADMDDVVVLCGKLEADITALDDPEERDIFLREAGIDESGLSKLSRLVYHRLGLRTFFTVGGKENRAWAYPDGASAREAAGIIHTDFARGFIKAEVYHCDDLFDLGDESKIRAGGKLRLEGRDYQVQDGDIMHFKFNV